MPSERLAGVRVEERERRLAEQRTVFGAMATALVFGWAPVLSLNVARSKASIAARWWSNPRMRSVWRSIMLGQCAWAAARSPDTYLSAHYWHLARRIGKKRAATAVDHSILVICWHLLANNADYDDLGGDYFARRVNTARRQDRLVQQLQDLGYQSPSRRLRHERPPARSRLFLFTGGRLTG